MIKSKIKTFLKANTVTSLWLVCYVAIQSLTAMAVLIYKTLTDMEFAEKFLVIFEPILVIESTLEKQWKTYEGLSILMSGKMGVILLISSLLLMLIITLNILVGKKTLDLYRITNSEVIEFCFLGTILNLFLTLLVSLIPASISKSHDVLTNLAVSNGLGMDVLATGIVVPICEELIFRYCILRSLLPINRKFAVVYQALLFGLLHGNLVQATYAFGLGCLFGYLYLTRKNLLYPILLHVSINLSSVLVFYMGIGEGLGLTILSAFLFCLLLRNKFAILLQRR